MRSCISQLGWDRAHLTEVARTLHMTSRTLIRRLTAEDKSFQAIKDALRRDIAIRHLAIGVKSIEEVAHEVGFSSNANFYSAFQSWTGQRQALIETFGNVNMIILSLYDNDLSSHEIDGKIPSHYLS